MQNKTVQLVADNHVIAEQINPGHQINLIPRQVAALDVNVHQLDLVIKGSTEIVGDVEIKLRVYRH